MASAEITSNLKLITSGTIPTTSNLANGELAFGLVGGVAKLYGNVNGAITDFSNFLRTATIYTATLSSASWTGSSSPYSKSITISGILLTDQPDIDLDLSSVDYADVAAMRTNWAKVYRAVTSANAITFYASEVLSADINLQIKVVR